MQTPIRHTLDIVTNLACAACLLTAGLAACGGGSSSTTNTTGTGTGGSTGTQPNNISLQSTTPTSLSSTVITIDPAAPPPIVGAVKKILSPFGSGSTGQTISVPSTNGQGDTLVMAVDVDNNILLAAMTSTSATVLNSDTTAQALTRIMVGAVPQGFTSAQLNSAIRSVPSFKSVVAAVDASFAKGISPMLSEGVATAIGSVIKEIAAPLSAPPAVQTAAASGTSLLGISTKQANGPSPYLVVGSKVAGVYISRGGVELTNAMPIVWRAFTSVSPSAPQKLPAANQNSALLLSATGGGGAGFLNSLAGVETTKLPNNGGKAYDLTVLQDEQSREENSKAIAFDTLSLIMSFTAAHSELKQECAAQIINVAFKPDEIGLLAGAPSATNLIAYIRSIGNQETLNAIESCVAGIAKPSAEYITAIVKTVTGVAEAGLIKDALGLAAKIATTVVYWSASPTTVGVCEELGAGGYALVNCAARFDVEPIPSMAPGAETDIRIKAFDTSGKPTAVPIGLSITSAGDGTVIKINKDNYKLTALSEGLVGIVVKDTETEVTATGKVTVIEPVLSPPSGQTGIGGVVKYSLVDPDGKEILLPTAPVVDVASLQPAIAEYDQQASAALSLFSPTLVVIGKSVGQATIMVTHPLWKTKPTATVFVGAAEPVVAPPPPTPLPGAPSAKGPSICRVVKLQNSTEFERFVRMEVTSDGTSCLAPLGDLSRATISKPLHGKVDIYDKTRVSDTSIFYIADPGYIGQDNFDVRQEIPLILPSVKVYTTRFQVVVTDTAE